MSGTDIGGTAYESAYRSFADGQLEAALDQLRPLLGEEPDAVKPWLLEGRVRASLGEFKAAMRAMERACAVAPENVFAFSEYAHFLHFTGHCAEALDVIGHTDALEAPQDTRDELLLLKARVIMTLLQDGLLDALTEPESSPGEDDATGAAVSPEGAPESGSEGGPDVRRQLRVSPRRLSPADVHESARSLVIPATPALQDLLAQGEQLLAQLLQRNPRSHEAWDLRAQFAVLGGRPKDAVKAWQQALRNRPNEPQYLHELGVTLEGLRDAAGAKDAYQQLAVIERHRRGVPLQFPADAFAAIVQSVWTEIQEDLLAGLDIPLEFALWVEEIPSQALLERPDQSQPLDPWMPMFLDVEASNTRAPTIHIIFYQRNIEREAAADSLEELAPFVLELCEECCFLVDAMVNDDQIRS